ncbi:hypothetical protein FN846DRAFT_906845 [Sphaerosporella brunnea]|uniref:F-box domain-containing protein n=1 Tax=Sphaerosporella brunnea TaxID=1250544 RepID=A0A5J5EYQ7_9PEZI|nr:hypothetical protein FN846DRAFT_906845 [Sphaerosporella brunnea]
MSLLDLPNELLLQIALYLPDVHALVLTSRRLNHLFEPYLHQHITRDKLRSIIQHEDVPAFRKLLMYRESVQDVLELLVVWNKLVLVKIMVDNGCVTVEEWDDADFRLPTMSSDAHALVFLGFLRLGLTIMMELGDRHI